jgi:hypothetical protein
VTLDLTRPEHRNALFNACALTPEERAHYLAHMGDDNGPCVQFCRALSSASDSAAIVRALLEGCGVTTCALYDESCARPCVALGPYERTIAWEHWTTDGELPEVEDYIYPRFVPALILMLLACTTREEALAALREAGR